MNRVQQIREIYAELRRVVGSEAPARDLIRLAFSIVDAHRVREDDSVDFEPKHGRSLYALPVDDAVMMHPWEVLELERLQWDLGDDEHIEPNCRFTAKIRSLVGRVVWPRIGTGLP